MPGDRLAGDVCIVTGGGRGIGQAVAQALGEEGATVIVNDLGSTVDGGGEAPAPAEQTAESIRDAGGEAESHFGDVSSVSYTEQLVEDVVERHGRIDAVANFAGIMDDSMVYRMEESQWDDVLRVNLRGHFSLLREVAAHWKETANERERNRSFLCTSSRSALGVVGQVNYSASKAGVLGFMRTAARELAQHDICVNALMPAAYTRMVEAIPEDARPFEAEEKPPEKVAPLVVYLLSQAASDVTGCTFRAGGDEIGLFSDPELTRLGVRPGGWTVDEIEERFRDDVVAGVELNKADHLWIDE